MTAARTRQLLTALLAGIALLATGCAMVMDPISAMTADVDFQTDSPSVSAIKRSLSLRFVQLEPHFRAGAIGLTQDGMIALRPAFALTPDAKMELSLLVSEDNKERGVLYREIARANGRPDWEGRFRYVFAERWIKRAPAGWYYRDSGGTWLKKSADSADSEKAEQAEKPAPDDKPA